MVKRIIIVCAILLIGGLVQFDMGIEPIDLSENTGYISFDPELNYIPPIPDGYITRGTVKSKVLNTFIITGTTVLDFAKPYYRPVNAGIVINIQELNQADQNPYNYPFYACDDYAESLWGDYNDDPDTANMPIYLAHIKGPNGHPHAALVTYYRGKLYFVDSTIRDTIWRIPQGRFELVLLFG